MDLRGPNEYVIIRDVEALRRVDRLLLSIDDRHLQIRRRVYNHGVIYRVYGYSQLEVDAVVAENMIREGELLMCRDPSTAEQDLHWRHDVWFQENRKRLYGDRASFMPPA